MNCALLALHLVHIGRWPICTAGG